MDEIRRIASPLTNKSYHPAQHLRQEPSRARAKRTLDEDALDDNVYTPREAILASREIIIKQIIHCPNGRIVIDFFFKEPRKT